MILKRCITQLIFIRNSYSLASSLIQNVYSLRKMRRPLRRTVYFVSVIISSAYIYCSIISSLIINERHKSNSNTQIRDFSKWKTRFFNLTRSHCDARAIKQPACLSRIRQFDQNLNLQTFTDLKCSECLQNEPKFLHQTFAHANDNFRKEMILRLLKLNIMSFLATRNLCCTKLIVWTLSDFYMEISVGLIKTFSHYISVDNLEVKEFNLSALCVLETDSLVKSIKLVSEYI
jgi:hypothetical protein